MNNVIEDNIVLVLKLINKALSSYTKKYTVLCLMIYFWIYLVAQLTVWNANSCFLLKGYLHYKTIFYNKVALDVELMIFIWRNSVSFSRYLDFYVFVKSTDFATSTSLLYNGRYTWAHFFWILSSIKMKFGWILVCCMKNVCNKFLTQC